MPIEKNITYIFQVNVSGSHCQILGSGNERGLPLGRGLLPLLIGWPGCGFGSALRVSLYFVILPLLKLLPRRHGILPHEPAQEVKQLPPLQPQVIIALVCHD